MSNLTKYLPFESILLIYSKLTIKQKTNFLLMNSELTSDILDFIDESKFYYLISFGNAIKDDKYSNQKLLQLMDKSFNNPVRDYEKLIKEVGIILNKNSKMMANLDEDIRLNTMAIIVLIYMMFAEYVMLKNSK